MKSKFALFLLCLALTPNAVLAETLKETADRICHAYIDHPEDFKKIKPTPCEIKYQDSDFKRDGGCAEYFDKLTNKHRKIARGYSSGSCISSDLLEIEEDGFSDGFEVINAGGNGYGFGARDEFLLYQGQLLITNEEDLRIPLESGAAVLCQFTYQSKNWNKADPETALCKKFENNEFVKNTMPLHASDNEILPDLNREGHPRERYVADLNRDGIKEDILLYEYASGRGCGCDNYSLSVLKDGELVGTRDGDQKSQDPNIILGNRLLGLNAGCNTLRNTLSVVKIDNKDYILKDYDYRDKALKLSKTIPSRALYEYQSGEFVKICSQEAEAEKVIQHEVVGADGKRPHLNYKPLE